MTRCMALGTLISTIILLNFIPVLNVNVKYATLKL